ncbi:NAD(P)H-dependent oxidoreductase [uncultured Ilumatobacter sp.]|uniref:NAD(P)H-dependent oxidoreductase n=1 Tax=uncultured Ilumatobacter sp. TaxID=879968 RepID=UPI00374F5B4F
MLALVIVAHPCGDSLTHALAARAEAGLRTAGYEVALLDLYALGFRAAMSEAERTSYHEDQPILDPIVAEHADLIKRATVVAFVYPTWWSGLPAILKGWLERVIVPGVGFRFDERTGKVKPGLGHVRRLVGISTYGSPRSAVRLINDNGRRTIARALRLSCGVRTRTQWLGLYSVDNSTKSERQDFAASVERTMASL